MPAASAARICVWNRVQDLVFSRVLRPVLRLRSVKSCRLYLTRFILVSLPTTGGS